MKLNCQIFFLSIAAFLPCIVFSDTVWGRPAWNGRIQPAAFSGDASRVACAMEDGRLLVRELESGEILLQASATLNALTGVRISPDGQRVVWGDVSGMLHSWSPDSGMISQNAGDMALTGLALSTNGAQVFVMGDGVEIRRRTASSLQSSYSRNLYIEQVHALAADVTGDYVIAGDHSGRANRVNCSTGATVSRKVSEYGLMGSLFLAGWDAEAILWDSQGSLFFTDSSLTVTGTLDLGGDSVNCLIEDPLTARLLIATSGGKVLELTLAEGTLQDSPIALLEQPAVGLGIAEDGAILAIDSSGTTWRLSSGTVEPLESPVAMGAVLRADLSLQSGLGVLMTDAGGWIARLNDGESEPIDPGATGILLDAGIFHGNSGTCPVQLVLDTGTLVLRLTGTCLPESLVIEEWTPTRLACGLWSGQIALMSSDGSLVILKEGADGFQELYAETASSAISWEDLSFVENDSVVLKQELANLDRVPAQDGPFCLDFSSNGRVRLSSSKTDPVFLAYPDLAPSGNSGMDTGVFGNVQAIRDSWILQREFGWGYLYPHSGASWYWFQNEGWLAGSPTFHPFMYSRSTGSWLYAPAAFHRPTDWIYDYAIAGWRRFTEGP